MCTSTFKRFVNFICQYFLLRKTGNEKNRELFNWILNRLSRNWLPQLKRSPWKQEVVHVLHSERLSLIKSPGHLGNCLDAMNSVHSIITSLNLRSYPPSLHLADSRVAILSRSSEKRTPNRRLNLSGRVIWLSSSTSIEIRSKLK